MARSSTPVRKAWRSLGWLAAIIVVLLGIQTAGALFAGWSWTPKLALDLEGGTRIVLQAQTAEDQRSRQEQLEQAVSIIRQRVDASGVSEAEISTQGADNIEVLDSGHARPGDAASACSRSSKLEFRAVILTGTPRPTRPATRRATPTPTDTATPTPTPTPTPSDRGDAEPRADRRQRPGLGHARAAGGVSTPSAATRSTRSRRTSRRPTSRSSPATTPAPIKYPARPGRGRRRRHHRRVRRPGVRAARASTPVAGPSTSASTPRAAPRSRT